ncbi:MAG: 5-dehydro-4-deoxyglucarate dehydratase [Demequina sp.]
MRDLMFGDGVYFFPVTPFDDAGEVDTSLAVTLVDEGVGHGAGAVFPACGTGEFHALSVEEHRRVVEATVRAVAGRVPVVAGAGGPLGHALAVARAAEQAGADALLVMPPYLVQGPQSGIVAYVEALLAATTLPAIVYHRANAQLTRESAARLFRHPQVVGLKDGVGDVALAQQFVLEARACGRDILFFNGLLTAEASQAAYRAIGVPLYSSAAFAMVPEVATAFHRALSEGDVGAQARLLDGFYTPLIALRDETPGFAVSLIKAGLRLAGHRVGSVRPPLADPSPEQADRLADILERGRVLVA